MYAEEGNGGVSEGTARFKAPGRAPSESHDQVVTVDHVAIKTVLFVGMLLIILKASFLGIR